MTSRTPVLDQERDGPNQPLVTVVVAAYDADRFIDRTLRSIQAQTYPRWECVVVDDGSTDDTAAVVERFARDDDRISLLQQPNQGTPTARNAGIASASADSEFLAFLDSDDLWQPDALDVLVAALAADPAAVSSYGMADYIDETDQVVDGGRHPAAQRDRRVMGRLDLVDLPPSAPYTHEAMVVTGTLWPTGVALHRTAEVARAGGFDPFFRQIQDWELYLRMTRRGHMTPVDRVVAGYRQHPANVTKRSDRVALYSQWVRWKTWSSVENSAHQLRINRRVWRRLTLRWSVWGAQATCRAVAQRAPATAARAAVDTARLAGSFLRGRPVRPTDRWVGSYVRVVSDRQFGNRPSS